MNPVIGDIEGNVRGLMEAYARANASGSDVVVFGELSITGYPPEDLVLKDGFVAANRRALDQFVALTGDCAAVVGFVDRDGDDLYNAAAVCSNGLLHGVYRKQLLPNYRVFDEERYFTPGSSFSLYRIAGVTCGVTICEDIWVSSGPVRDQAAAGASLMLNINGSPFHRGRLGEREHMVSERARDNRCAIVYVNQVCGQDEVVFDGGSMVVSKDGHVVARSPQFVEDMLIVDLDVDVPADRHDSKIVEVSATSRRSGPRHEGAVTPALGDLAETYAALVLGTRDYVRKNGFTDVVVGLSGGIDSSLVAAIAVEALGAEHVHGVAMPARHSSEGSRTDARLLAENLGIE
jgi:NAD+ synthase (glutamine-hydrolysing)